MRRRKKRCLICKDPFDPNHRLRVESLSKAVDTNRQVTCGTPACRKKHKKQYDSSWHWKNRDLHNKATADWFRDHPGYMRKYMRRYRKGL